MSGTMSDSRLKKLSGHPMFLDKTIIIFQPVTTADNNTFVLKLKTPLSILAGLGGREHGRVCKKKTVLERL